MKKLNTPTMKKLLRKGARLAKSLPKIKSPDYYIPIFTHEIKNGWYYQIEKLYEGVYVYAFKPPRVYHAKSADYYLGKNKKQ